MYFLQVGLNTIIFLTFGRHTLFLSYLWASYFIFVLFLGIILLFVLFLRILVIFRPIFGTPTFICPIFGHPILFGPTSVHPIFCQSYFLLSYLCASYFWDPIFGSSYYCGRLWPVRTSIWDGSLQKHHEARLEHWIDLFCFLTISEIGWWATSSTFFERRSVHIFMTTGLPSKWPPFSGDIGCSLGRLALLRNPRNTTVRQRGSPSLLTVDICT